MPNYLEKMELLARTQGGYFYPWSSTVDPGDGERAYTSCVESYLRPDAVVLEAGCGHGADILVFAPRVGRYVAYDFAPSFIRIAEEAVRSKGLTNVELYAMDSSPLQNNGRPTLPCADQSVDLIISRRGPTNFILAAPRAVCPGGRLIQLNPVMPSPPPWNDDLPPAARIQPAAEPIDERIQTLLKAVGLDFESAKFFDVAEYFSDPKQLWLMLTWLKDDVPAIEDVRDDLERIIDKWGTHKGIAWRHQRFLWTAVV